MTTPESKRAVGRRKRGRVEPPVRPPILSAALKRRLRSAIIKRIKPTERPADAWYGSERWSFLGEPDLAYCPFDYDADFDGTTDGVTLPWSAARRAAIDAGADLTRAEMRQWQRAMAQNRVGDGGPLVIWMVPVKEITKAGDPGYAFFVGETEGAPEDEPGLAGIYASADDGKAALKKSGAYRPLPRATR